MEIKKITRQKLYPECDIWNRQIDSLMQKKHNSIANALEFFVLGHRDDLLLAIHDLTTSPET